MSVLTDLVLRKIAELGFPASASFFEVGEPLIRQWAARSKPVSLSAVEKVFTAPELPPITPSQEIEYQGKKVVLLLPWYREVSPLTAFSVMGLIDRAKVAVIMSFGDAFIIHSRNHLATQFLKTGVDNCLWVDADMVLPFGNSQWFNAYSRFNLPERFAGFHTINRLMSHGKTIVGATYYGRQPGGWPVYAEGASSKDEANYCRRGPYDLIKPTRWVGTGCMLMHKDVLLDIERVFPELARKDDKPGNWFSPSEHNLLKAANQSLEILNDPNATPEARVAKVKEILHEGQHRAKGTSRLGQGEDVTCCIRAAQAGHQPFVDLGLVCGHEGFAIYGPTT